jgi:ribosomal protein S18 acetylase RimI-like enzyme
MNPLLANILWHALSGPHASFSVGTGDVRRYAPGFSPIVGFADPANPHLDALRPYCQRDEHLYCAGWSGVAPEGWRIEVEATLVKMVWQGPVPALASAPEADEGPEVVRLGPAHASQALELATLTQPGPFGLRTMELGEYLGCFDGQRLVAMAGERMHAGPFREISGVCTHPDFQGRGLAQRLSAHRLYERMGFRDELASVCRVISLG